MSRRLQWDISWTNSNVLSSALSTCGFLLHRYSPWICVSQSNHQEALKITDLSGLVHLRSRNIRLTMGLLLLESWCSVLAATSNTLLQYVSDIVANLDCVDHSSLLSWLWWLCGLDTFRKVFRPTRSDHLYDLPLARVDHLLPLCLHEYSCWTFYAVIRK